MKYQDNLVPDVIYSSYQWFHVLDTLSELALREMLEHTSLLEYYASQLMVFQHTNKRKAVSLEHKWKAVLSKLSAFIADPTPENFLEVNLDRGYTQSMIFNFLTLVDGYEGTYQKCFLGSIKSRSTGLYQQLETYHTKVGVKNARDILQLVSHVKHIFGEYLKVRDQIMLNYHKYISNKAIYETSKFNIGTSYDREDLH